MKFCFSKRPYSSLPMLAVCGVLAWVAAGCGRNDVQEYRVAKEPVAEDSQAQAPVATPTASAIPDASGSAPTIQWKRPDGWEEVPPGQMRVGSFRVAGKDGKQADVSIVPLGGMAGTDVANVNRWRGQVGLSPVSETEIPKLAEPVQIAGQSGELFEVAGSNSGSGEKVRILAAVLRREGTAWFFKMTGDDDLVAQQKPVFVEFLKNVSFSSGGTPQLPPDHPAVASSISGFSPAPSADSVGSKPAWQVPSAWREIAGGQFLVAKFVMTGAGDAQAAVNVSKSAGDGGGLLANVNRWRGQLGLAPIAEADLQQQAQAVDVAGGKATVVEMSGVDGRTGQRAGMIGAIVPQGGDTWFYKLMGDPEIVAREKDAFTKFVQSAKYPNAS